MMFVDKLLKDLLCGNLSSQGVFVEAFKLFSRDMKTLTVGVPRPACVSSRDTGRALKLLFQAYYLVLQALDFSEVTCAIVSQC